MKVALVGVGHWGQNLARNLSSLGALGALCELNPERLAQAARLYPGAYATCDYEAILQDPSWQAVALATPAARHYSMARAALLAGKDVFVEKPLALRVEEGEHLVRLAAERGRVLMVGHLMEHHGAIERLVALVRAGTLGRLEYLYSNRLNLGKVRREENALWSFAPHDIAVFLRLVGASPLKVIANGGAYLQPHIADVTVTHILFPGEVRAHLFVSWLHPFKEQKLVVIGTRKMAVFDDVRPTGKLVLYDRNISLIEGEFFSQKVLPEPVLYDETEPLRRECAHFLECIKTRRAPYTDGESGVAVLRVLEASQRSLEQDGAPVLLAPDHAA